MEEALYSKNKQIDPLTNKIVFGYIHRLENSYLDGNSVPIEIINVCLLYYLFFREKFNKNSHGEGLIISWAKAAPKYMAKLGECNTIQKRPFSSLYTSESDAYNSAFGSVIIDAQLAPNSIYQWTLKSQIYVASWDIPCIKIGIVSIDCDDINANCFSESSNYPNFGCDVLCYTKFGIEYFKQRTYHNAYIDIRVDTGKGTIQYIENGVDYGIQHKDIDFSIKYKFAISLSNPKDIVEIIDFRIQ